MSSQNKNAVLISLGHNSSAIYTNGTANIGYEQERLNREKSSSRPPLRAIREIEEHAGIPQGTPFFVTHWFDSFDRKLPECKYFQMSKVIDNKDSKLITHTKDFTHHDAHAWSSYSFYKYYEKSARKRPVGDTMHFIVADGFGNFQEVISIYSMSIKHGKGPKLVCRYYGYESSLGLMYQYATAYTGMKMNQDEYKFLGYESNLQEGFLCKDNNFNVIHGIEALCTTEIHRFITRLDKEDSIFTNSSELINFDTLHEVQDYWNWFFTNILSIAGIDSPHSEEARIVIGYSIQLILERMLQYLLVIHNIDNVCLSGGVFYNVKLNNHVLKDVEGSLCVVPLAGDQGAAIGFYQKFVGDFNWSTLAIGERGFYKQNIKSLANKDLCIFVPDSREEALELLRTKIAAGEICNFVTSKMEYGPRALGHTSSLFLPTEENAQLNNKLNNRNEVMPFAPLILDTNLSSYFEKDQFERIIGSDEFMIVTYDYIKEAVFDYDIAGVMHNYPIEPEYSGRPQVVTAKNYSFLYELMVDLYVDHKHGLITNTSYNYHGEPIVFRTMEMIATHTKQRINAAKLGVKVNLIIYNPN